MNPVIRAQVDQFKESNPVASYSESDYFECYSIFSLLNGYLGENVDPFDAHLAGTEFGVDGACILVEGRVASDPEDAASLTIDHKDNTVDFIFIQSKSGTNFDYGDVSKFFDAAFGFFTGTMAGESIQLDTLIETKDAIYQKPLRKNPRIFCMFVTSGTYQPSNRIEILIENQRRRLNELNLFQSIEIRLLGARELQKAYRAATSSNSSEIDFPKCQTLPQHPRVKQAYIGYLKADQLLRIGTRPAEDGAQQINPSVFFDNVRDFDPDSKINKSIIDEIRSGDRKGFVFRNNGVTVIAKRLNRTGDRFVVEDYQVVNGCQTTNILFHSKDIVDDLFVPFRLIESSDDEFITSIIVGTNTQNPVRDEQFWALRPFMKDLEEFCRQQNGDLKLFVERRENQYRDGGVERTRVIKPSDIMKAVAAMYLFQPHRAARDFRGIRSEYEKDIFLSNHNVLPYHLASYANYKFEFFVRNNRLLREDRIYKYYVLCSVGYQFCGGKNIFRMRSGEQQSISEEIRSLLGDEAKFLAYSRKIIESVKELAAGKFSVTLTASREKLRDTLRTESFSKAFLEQIPEN